MELRHLRYFVALAKHLNFTRAAEYLHITQSTLSHQIRGLEEELKLALFARSGRRVTLTPAGKNFLSVSVRTLNEIDRGIFNLKNDESRDAEQLHVGANNELYVQLMMSYIVQFLKINPNFSVHAENLTMVQIKEQLIREQIDISIVYCWPDLANLCEFHVEPLFNETLVLAIPEGHPFSQRSHVELADLHQQRMILPSLDTGFSETLNRKFSLVGAKPIILAELSTMALGLDIAKHLNALTLAPKKLAQSVPGLNTIPLEALTLMVAIIWKQGRPLPIGAQRFIEMVKNVPSENESTTNSVLSN